MDSLNVWARGRNGGLCWGDSGGPLLRHGESAIAGVLADFANGYFRCEEGNRMIFTSLWAERDFLLRSGVPASSFEDPIEPTADADADGVPDSLDRCSRSPVGSRVWTEGDYIGCAGGEYRDR
jgi:hypothetical protein